VEEGRGLFLSGFLPSPQSLAGRRQLRADRPVEGARCEQHKILEMDQQTLQPLLRADLVIEKARREALGDGAVPQPFIETRERIFGMKEGP
jgi:hypothetical protein